MIEPKQIKNDAEEMMQAAVTGIASLGYRFSIIVPALLLSSSSLQRMIAQAGRKAAISTNTFTQKFPFIRKPTGSQLSL